MTELQVGVHGLRTFRVSDDANLLPVTAVDDSWRGGVCIARCRRNPRHSAPADRCRCGIYTFRNLSILRSQYEPANHLVAVVALEGQTLAGSRGWRSQAGRVVALWVESGALPDPLLHALSGNLPGVPFHTDVARMLVDYPELSDSAAAAGVITTGRPFPLRPRPVRPHLVLMFFLLVALGTLLFVAGGHRLAGTSTDSVGWSHLGPGTSGTITAGTGAPSGDGPQSPLDAALLAAGRCGAFLAAHDLLLLVPLLFLGVLLAARQPAGPVAALVAGTAWLVSAAVAAAVLAALVVGNEVQFNLFAAWMVLVFGWRWLGLLLFSVGNADGLVGYFARSVLRAHGAVRRVLSPGRPATGVGYRPRPDHCTSCYPLMVPVHFR